VGSGGTHHSTIRTQPLGGESGAGGKAAEPSQEGGSVGVDGIDVSVGIGVSLFIAVAVGVLVGADDVNLASTVFCILVSKAASVAVRSDVIVGVSVDVSRSGAIDVSVGCDVIVLVGV